MARPTTAALYVRTSTVDQHGKAQLHTLRKVARARGLRGKEYVDLGHSGAKASRPGLDLLRQDARRGEVSLVLVTALDRLGRSLTDLLHLLEELRAAGCVVVSLREGVDLGTPAGRLQVQLLGAIAEFERALAVERVHAGLAAARARGQVLGRPRSIHAPEPDEVARRRTLGESWATIGKALRCTPSAARRAAAMVATKLPARKVKR
jgi:DNA invertase Pin-like site-specific DNA recombinase